MSSPTLPHPTVLPLIEPPRPIRDGLDVLAVLALMYAVRFLAPRLGLTHNIGAVAVIFGVTLATVLLTSRGESWRTIGWRRPDHLGRAAIWALGTFLVLMVALPTLLEPLAGALALPPQHLERLGDLRSDTTRFLVLLFPLGWGTAAFGEELLYRGFFNTRLARTLGGGRVAVAAGALGQAVFFGLAHLYLGPRGILNAFAIGLVSATVYLKDGKNLWPLIVAHGLVDTVGLTAIRLGLGHPV
jgi:CAAX protease family protein